MNGTKYSVSVRTRIGASAEEALHYLQAGRREAGNKLYDILYSQKLPAVVEIEEISIPPALDEPYGMRYENELRIEIVVTPVQHRHVVMSHADFEYAQHSVQRTAGTWRKFINFVGRVAGSLRHR